jgi:hypothetical protein
VIPGIAAVKGGGGLFGCCKKGVKNLNVYNPDEIEELDDVEVSPGNERRRSAGREWGCGRMVREALEWEQGLLRHTLRSAGLFRRSGGVGGGAGGGIREPSTLLVHVSCRYHLKPRHLFTISPPSPPLLNTHTSTLTFQRAPSNTSTHQHIYENVHTQSYPSPRPLAPQKMERRLKELKHKGRTMTIDPRDNEWMTRWDFFMLILMAFTAIVTPFEVAFLQPKFNAMYVINRIVDTGFVTDMIMNFFLAYLDTEKNLWVFERSFIIKR